MNAQAVSVLLDLVNASLSIAMKLQQVSTLIQKAQMEGRELSKDEWDAIKSLADKAESRLEAAVK